MKAGDQLTPLAIGRISEETLRLWADFLEDPNPIHLDPAATAALGLGNRVISQGPANLAYVINLLMANFPGKRIGSINTQFADNVFAGDIATAAGQILSADDGSVTCEAWLQIEGRGKAILCEATIYLKD